MRFLAQAVLELIQHAEEHKARGRELDLRAALISFDQATDLSITLFYTRDLRAKAYVDRYGGAAALRADRRLRTECLCEVCFDEGLLLSVEELTEIQRLRNRLYHEEVDVAPTRIILDAAHGIANCVVSALFGGAMHRVQGQLSELSHSFSNRTSNTFFPVDLISGLSRINGLLQQLLQLSDIEPLDFFASRSTIREEWNVLSGLNANALAPLADDFESVLDLADAVKKRGFIGVDNLHVAGLLAACDRLTKAVDALRVAVVTKRVLNGSDFYMWTDEEWERAIDDLTITLALESGGVFLRLRADDGRLVKTIDLSEYNDSLVNVREPLLAEIERTIEHVDVYNGPFFSAEYGLIMNLKLLPYLSFVNAGFD